MNNFVYRSLTKLINSITKDRELLQNTISRQTDEVVAQINKFDLLLKIQEIGRIIAELQDNIIFSKVNLIHPSLFTQADIRKYDINADKLKGIRIGFTKTSTNKLLFLVKIPYKLVRVNKQIITPLRNTNTCAMIVAPRTELIEFNNKYYEFDNSKDIHQLNTLNHCVMNKNCDFRTNCNSEIFNIDDSSILIQLAKNVTLTSDRDIRQYTLNGNYYIRYYNCTIKLGNITYSNNIEEIPHQFVIPNLNFTIPNNTLTFTEIILQHEHNLEKIKELVFHKKISYQYILPTTIIVVVVMSIILYL